MPNVFEISIILNVLINPKMCLEQKNTTVMKKKHNSIKIQFFNKKKTKLLH
jgi:hypothetical protein